VATFRKRGKKWYAEIMLKGKRKGRSFDTKAAAKQWADGETESPTTSIYTHDMAEKYITEVVVKHKSAEETGRKIRRLVLMLPDVLAEDLTREMMTQWKKKAVSLWAPSTVNLNRTLLSVMFNHAILEWGYMRSNPFKGVKTPKGADRERIPTDAESAAILGNLGGEGRYGFNRSQVAISWQLALLTAMRKIELLSICPENTDLVNQVVTLTDTKNGDTRQVPLSAEAVRLIRLLPGEAFSIKYKSHSAIFCQARKKAGIKDLHFHDSRAYAIGKLSKVPGIDVLTLARIVGHRDIQSLMIYYREPAADVAKLLG